MKTSTLTVPTVHTAAALEAQARREGYRPGFPAHLSPADRRVDLGVCRRMTCPGCGSRGMGARPYHKPGGYRVVAACPKCGAGETV